MRARIQKRKSHRKYFTYYLDLPKEALAKAKWLKRQKVVELEIDLLGNLVVKPGR